MGLLSRAHLMRLDALMRALAVPATRRELPGRLVSALGDLVPADVISYNEISVGGAGHPIVLKYQMAFSLPAPARTIVGIAVNRASGGFTDEERMLADLARGHLVHFFRAAETQVWLDSAPDRARPATVRAGRPDSLYPCRRWCPGATSMADADDVRRFALALPHVVEIDSDGFDFRVADKGFVWSYPERRPGKQRAIRIDIAVLYVGDEAEKQALLLGEPERFFTTPGYDGMPLVMLWLEKVDADRLEELVTDAWRMRAPDTLLADLDATADSSSPDPG